MQKLKQLFEKYVPQEDRKDVIIIALLLSGFIVGCFLGASL